MTTEVTFTPVILARTITDRHALLIFWNGELVGVLVRLDDDAHEELKRCWVLEVGFGPFDVIDGPIFDTLDEVERWVLDIAYADAA